MDTITLKDIYNKLTSIEKEIETLKILILQSQQQKEIISLKGVLRGIKISEEDFEEAKIKL